MLWNPTTYLQTCIQIVTAEEARHLFWLYRWKYINKAIFKSHCTGFFTLPLCLLTYNRRDDLGIKMLLGIPALIPGGGRAGHAGMWSPSATCLQVRWCIAVGWTVTVRAVCCCSLCHSTQGTSTPSPSLQVPRSSPDTTVRYSFTATLVFIISAARPH